MLKLSLPSVRGDRVFAVAIALLIVGAGFTLFSPADDARAGPLLGRSLPLIAALLAVLPRPAGEPARTRTFWRLIALGLSIFMVNRIWRVAASLGVMPPIASAPQPLIYLGRSLFMVMALETRPDFHQQGRAEADLRQLDMAGAVLFLFSLVAYVVLSPPPRGGAAGVFSVRELYLVIDIFLALRVITLAVRAPTLHWRSVYGWLGAVFVLRGVANFFGGDPVAATAVVPIGTGPPAGRLAFLVFAPLIVAARLEQRPAADAAGSRTGGAAEGRLAPLVAYAFTFPIFHFLMERLGIVEDENAGPRQMIVLGFLGSTAALLWVYQRVLIRENRRLEAERQLLAEQAAESRRMDGLGRLAGGVAHDFNNLLTVIRGRTELMLVEHGSAPQMREDLEAIREAARRGEGVTRQLLAFGRRQILRPEVLDAGRVVNELAPLLRSAVSEEVRLTVSVRDDAPFVVADQGQIEMALLNLAVNAREAMPGGGLLAIDVERIELDEPRAAEVPQAKAGDYVRLTVRDTGRGMDEATLERIFDPFFTTKPFGSGAGLGLPAVHGFVKQSGGAIQVESAPGRGATFRIYLPRVARPAEQIHGEGGAVVERRAEIRRVAERRDEVGGNGRAAAVGERRAAVVGDRRLGGRRLDDQPREQNGSG